MTLIRFCFCNGFTVYSKTFLSVNTVARVLIQSNNLELNASKSLSAKFVQMECFNGSFHLHLLYNSNEPMIKRLCMYTNILAVGLNLEIINTLLAQILMYQHFDGEKPPASKQPSRQKAAKMLINQNSRSQDAGYLDSSIQNVGISRFRPPYFMESTHEALDIKINNNFVSRLANVNLA